MKAICSVGCTASEVITANEGEVGEKFATSRVGENEERIVRRCLTAKKKH